MEKAKGAELYIPVPSAVKFLKYPLDLVDCRTVVNLETTHQQTSIIEIEHKLKILDLLIILKR